MKHPLKSYTTGAYKSCQLQNELNILINIVQKYPMQQCIKRMPVPIVPRCHLEFQYTKVVICKCCIQKIVTCNCSIQKVVICNF